MPTAASTSPVQIGPSTTGGLLVRLNGRCTMQHSPATEAFVDQSLRHDPTVTVAIDLNRCTYLDSTFLGCLFGLNRRHAATPRFRIHASAQVTRLLLVPMRLDKVIRIDESPAPEFAGTPTSIGDGSTDRKALSRHVMETHRRLAEADTPARAAFLKIAEAMERELKGS